MNRRKKSKKDVIAALCREFEVRRLAVFGSALGRDFGPALRDVDLVVDFLPISEYYFLDCNFGLKPGLESLFARLVDLIELDTLRSKRSRKIIDDERVQVIREKSDQADNFLGVPQETFTTRFSVLVLRSRSDRWCLEVFG